jgi:hypothetical protein
MRGLRGVREPGSPPLQMQIEACLRNPSSQGIAKRLPNRGVVVDEQETGRNGANISDCVPISMRVLRRMQIATRHSGLYNKVGVTPEVRKCRFGVLRGSIHDGGFSSTCNAASEAKASGRPRRRDN